MDGLILGQDQLSWAYPPSNVSENQSETLQLSLLPKKIRKDEPFEGFFWELHICNIIDIKNSNPANFSGHYSISWLRYGHFHSRISSIGLILTFTIVTMNKSETRPDAPHFNNYVISFDQLLSFFSVNQQDLRAIIILAFVMT